MCNISLINYYIWTDAFYDNFSIYLTILNWEDASFLLNNDVFFLFSLFEDSFIYIYFSTLNISFYSFLDYFFEITSGDLSQIFAKYFFIDLFIFMDIIYKKLTLFFFVNNVDYLLFFFTTNNELIFFFIDWNAWILNFNIFFNHSVLYDVFNFNIFFSYLNYIVFLKWFFIFFIIFLFFFNIVRFNSITSTNNYFFYRLYFFIYSISLENRIQFDFFYLFIIFIFFIWIIVLLTFNDIYSEVVELFHLFLIYFFMFIIVYLLFKYSIHYFSFLENSVSEGYTVAFITKQMVRDISNTFALLLRFFVLLFRLNIYDGLDDFLDSYYIFFCDFDEDSFWDENFLTLNSYFYFFDNHEDVIFYLNTEQDWLSDLFSNYFIIFGKFYFFLFFILEETFRVSLALYIFYLIIFEVHSVNISYSEDNFINSKRN